MLEFFQSSAGTVLDDTVAIGETPSNNERISET